MKTLLLFLSICSSCLADNWAVTFWSTIPTNDPMRVAGCPTNQPIQWSDIGNSTNVTPPAVCLSDADLANCFTTNLAAFQAAQSNAQHLAQVQTATNYAAWSAIYAQMPQGIADSSNRIVTATNLLWSFKSGTNSAAGTNAIIVQMLQSQQYAWTYLNQIIGYLSRLGPGLQAIYQPANDPVGH